MTLIRPQAPMELLRTLADPHRLRILDVLSRKGEQSQSDLIRELGLAQPTVAYHARRLSEAGLIVREKRGTSAINRIPPAVLVLLVVR